MPTPHQPPKTQGPGQSADFTDSLKVPSREHQAEAFLRSGTGTEILPGRFVMEPTASLWCILHSEITDPQFTSAIIALAESPLSEALKFDITRDIVTGFVDRFNKKVQAGAVLSLPTALYPGSAIDLSPVFWSQTAGAPESAQGDLAHALRHVVRDGHVIVPKGSRWTPYDVVAAEFVAAAVSDGDIRWAMNRSFDMVTSLLSAMGPAAKDGISLITPQVGVGIRGPLFWAKAQLGSRERGQPSLHRALVERLEPVFGGEIAEEHKTAFRRGSEAAAAALDQALIPAKNTIDALRAYERNHGGITERTAT